MTDYKITRAIEAKEEEPTAYAYQEVLDMLCDRLSDAEDEVTRANAKVSVIRDMIHEINLKINHMITG